MPESEDAKRLREAFEAFKRGDAEPVRHLIADDMVLYRPEPDDATFEGPDGFFAAVADWMGQFEGWRIEDDELREYPGGVVIRTRQAGRPRGSAMEVVEDFWIAHVFRDGKVARMGIYPSEGPALEFVGERR